MVVKGVLEMFENMRQSNLKHYGGKLLGVSVLQTKISTPFIILTLLTCASTRRGAPCIYAMKKRATRV